MNEERLNEIARELMPLLKNDAWAVQFCVQWIRVGQFWDDLIDRDCPFDNARIHLCMETAVLDIPENPFFQAHALQLLPMMRNAVLCWKDSNDMERRDSEHARVLAFGLRSAYTELLNYVAYLVGGMDWAEKVGPALRLLNDETIQDYWEDHDVLQR